jgi:UDPglucose 6-dehydrogenase
MNGAFRHHQREYSLQDAGAVIQLFDPERMATPAMTEGVRFGEYTYAVAAGDSALELVTEWNEFRALDFQRLRETMADSLLVDLRNVYDPREVTRHGFRHLGVGRPADAGLGAIAAAAEQSR